MKHIVKLRSTIPVDNVFPAIYTIGKKTRILTSDTSFVEIDTEKTRDPNYIMPTTAHIAFTTRALEREFAWDDFDEQKDLDAFEKQKYLLIEEFLKAHPLTLINGKPHSRTMTGSPVYYDIIDVNMKVVSELTEWLNKYKICAHLDSLSLEHLRDVCYYYAVQPKNKTKGRLLLELADFNKGVLFVKLNGAENKIADYMDVWMSNTAPDKEMYIMCRKAVELGVVTESRKEGNISYYLGSELLGHTINDIVVFAKQNAKSYESYIVRGVKGKDNFQEEIIATNLENKSIEGISVDNNAITTERLRTEVMDLFEEVHAMIGSKAMTVPKAGIKSAKKVTLQGYLDTLTQQKEEHERKEVADPLTYGDNKQ